MVGIMERKFGNNYFLLSIEGIRNELLLKYYKKHQKTG